MSKMIPPKYAQLVSGLWLKVPVGDSGRGVALVAKVWKPKQRVAVAMGYFFARSFAATVSECQSEHKLDDADLVTIFYGANKDFQRWGVIDLDEKFRDSGWVIPEFYDPLTRSLVTFGEDIDSEPIAQRPIPSGRTSVDYPRVGQESAGTVSASLERIDRERRIS